MVIFGALFCGWLVCLGFVRTLASLWLLLAASPPLIMLAMLRLTMPPLLMHAPCNRRLTTGGLGGNFARLPGLRRL